MVSSGILEYMIPGEVINNYTIGYGIYVNPTGRDAEQGGNNGDGNR